MPCVMVWKQRDKEKIMDYKTLTDEELLKAVGDSE